MKKMILIPLLFIMTSSLNVWAAPSKETTTTAKVGKAAPDFTLKGHDGKSYKLSDFKGKYVVLEWFNHECPYVKKHYDLKMSNMQNTQKVAIETAKKNKKELVWFTIVSSAPGKQGHIDAQKAKSLKEELKGHMTAFLFDIDGKVGRSYQAKTTPHMYIIAPDGVLKYDGGMDDKPSAQLSSLSGAQNYVQTALNSLFTNKAIAKAKTKPYGCSVKY